MLEKLQDRLKWLEKFDNPEPASGNAGRKLFNKSHKNALLDALKECRVSRRLSRGRRLHALAKQVGLDSDLRIANSLISFYSKCGSVLEARDVFQNMELHDVVSWNALIAGYAEHGQDNFTALELFASMRAEGCSPDSRTYVAVLKACSSLAERESSGKVFRLASLEKGMAVHSEAWKLGLDRDVYVGTSLVDMYVKCGSLEDATRAFERMVEHNVISWTALVSGYGELGQGRAALELFTLMQREVCGVDGRAVVAALKACSSLVTGGKTMVSLERVMAIHALAVENGLERDIYVGSSLVDVYVKLGRTEEARRVFDDIPGQDVVLWTALLRGYGENGRAEVALQMFSSMIAEGCAPNSQTLVAVVKACSTSAVDEPASEVGEQDAKRRSLEVAMALHSEARTRNLELDIHLGCSLVDVYGKCGRMELARDVFETMLQHNLVSWNALLLGYVENGGELTALELFGSMQAEGFVPDDRTFACMFKACSSLGAKNSSQKLRWLEAGMSLHSRASSTVCPWNVYITSSLIDMYSNCGSMVDARAVFDDSPSKDTVVWTALILGYAENGQGKEALELFASMQAEGYRRDTRTYAAALKACTSSVSINEARALHAETCRVGVERDSVLVNSLLDFYGKCGDLHHAQMVFDSASVGSLSTVTWNSLLAGYSHQGNVDRADRVFGLLEEMVARGFNPDGVTFVLVLSVCSHAGLVDRGREYFTAMGVKYGVEAGIEHFHCMVDMLGRGNRVEEALKMAEEMPFKSNVVTWTTLLGACRLWRNAEVGRVAFERVVELERGKAAPYVLLSKTLENI